ncbi:MAG: hypothetical protein R2851_13615 [Caldilineaceae bacterium]
MSARIAIVTGAAQRIEAVAEALAADGAGRGLRHQRRRGCGGGPRTRRLLRARRPVHGPIAPWLARRWRATEASTSSSTTPGFQHIDAIDAFPEDTWDTTLIALMLTTPFLLTKYVWPSMQARQSRIINIGSVHSLRVAVQGRVHQRQTRPARPRAPPRGRHTRHHRQPDRAGLRARPWWRTGIADQARTGISEDEVVEKVMLAPAAIKERLVEPNEVGDLVIPPPGQSRGHFRLGDDDRSGLDCKDEERLRDWEIKGRPSSPPNLPISHLPSPQSPHSTLPSKSGRNTTLSCSLGSVRAMTAEHGSLSDAL